MAPKRSYRTSNSEVDVAQKIIKTAPNIATFRHAQEIVYAVIGPEKTRFGLHKDLLCNMSPFFKAALGGGFKEAALREVALPDFDVAAFERFNEYLYTGKITEEPCVERDLSNLELYAKDVPNLRQLLHVWLLADYLMVPKLQNYVVDIMWANMRQRKVAATLADFAYFYEHTAPGSLMRKFIVDICVWSPFDDGSCYQQTTGSVPEEMGFDLLVAISRRAGNIGSSPFSIGTSHHVPEYASEKGN